MRCRNVDAKNGNCVTGAKQVSENDRSYFIMIFHDIIRKVLKSSGKSFFFSVLIKEKVKSFK